MKKLAILLSIVLVLIASLSIAAATDTKLLIKDTSIKDEITYLETAEFDLEIVNPLLLTEEIYIISPITSWAVSLSDTRVVVPYGQSRRVKLSMTPPETIRPGKYISCFTFKGMDHPTVSNHRCIFITVTEGSPQAPEEPKPEGKADIKIKEEAVEKFLTSTHIIILKNEGDATAEGEYKSEFELLASFLVSSTPLSSGIRSTSDGKEFYWKYTLLPGDSLEINYTVSYLPLVFSVAVVIVALMFLMSFYSSGLKIDKRLLIPSKKAHGQKAVKVKLSIKNNTNKEYKNVHVEDYLPTPLHLTEDFGTIEPSIVKKSDEQIRVVWNLPELAPKEERIISYSFKSKMEIIGKIMLPRARIVYTANKKKRTIYSGLLVVRGKKEEQIE